MEDRKDEVNEKYKIEELPGFPTGSATQSAIWRHNFHKNIAEGTRRLFYTIGRSSLPAAETLRRRRRRRRRRKKHDS